MKERKIISKIVDTLFRRTAEGHRTYSNFSKHFAIFVYNFQWDGPYAYKLNHIHILIHNHMIILKYSYSYTYTYAHEYKLS